MICTACLLAPGASSQPQLQWEAKGWAEPHRNPHPGEALWGDSRPETLLGAAALLCHAVCAQCQCYNSDQTNGQLIKTHKKLIKGLIKNNAMQVRTGKAATGHALLRVSKWVGSTHFHRNSSKQDDLRSLSSIDRTCFLCSLYLDEDITAQANFSLEFSHMYITKYSNFI